MHRAWTFCASKDAKPLRQTLVESLRSVGIADDAERSDDLASSGIAVLTRVDGAGCDRLREVTRRGERRVLVVVADDEPLRQEEAWRLLETGVEDVIVCRRPESTARQIAARFERWASVDRLLESEMVRTNLIGSSPVWRSLLRRVVEAGRFGDDTVLIIGETGTGKELVARLVHTLGRRGTRSDLVTVDCTTLSEELVGSELFGHERGAFTGAVGPRTGAFELAHGGSLFLDEVGELPMALQPKLLRAVQEKTYKAVGGNRWRKTDFRLISATNRELDEDIAAGGFRNDLYFRIAGCVFHLPALRERREDVLPLAEHFLRRIFGDASAPELEPAVKAYLLTRSFPGNVRQLEHLMRQIGHRHVGSGPISIGAVPEHERPERECAEADWRDAIFDHAVYRAVALGASLREIGEHTKDTAIRLTVAETDGNLQRAARRLGVTDRTLQLRRAGRSRTARTG